jgi:tetratricopeptide (TPR) repeat protein/predicted Ser/Thr protein kinase
MPLQPNTVVASRFAIAEVLGTGGTSTVYRAWDREREEWVALKILARSGTLITQRLAREAAILTELASPGIVRYIGHGRTDHGEDYIAMEWLDGEDLATRLQQGPLDVGEAVVLLCKVAEALMEPHARGIVHRDIKPGNLLIVGGQVERVKILDFGIARRLDRSGALTRTGAVLGTPLYLAPEQARAEADVGPAADIFSLGCVLYECLTGQPAFAASNMIAVMAKILFEENPRLRTVLPDAPPALEALLARMLAKDVRHRLPDAAALVAALPMLDAGAPADSRSTLISAERLLVSVIVATPPPELGDVSQDELRAGVERLRATLRHPGAELELLSDGSLVVSIVEQHGALTEQVVAAARCALAVREHFPDAIIALTTCHMGGPRGHLTDRMAQLLDSAAAPEARASGEIVVDEASARLLETRVRVRRSSSGLFTIDRAGVDNGIRLLLGKPTPFVGRELELRALETTLAACVDEGVPRAVLVLAEAGNGKSRLRQELLRRVQARDPALLVLAGYGDPMSSGSAYGMLRQALRRFCGLLEGENEAEARSKIEAHVPTAYAPFIGELCGVPFPEDDDVRLRSARQDPAIMAERMHDAFVDFVAHESARRPVLLVLEDLQWSDRMTLRLVDATMRLSDRQLMVLALARPEAAEIVEAVWPRSVQRLPLLPLSRRACEQLVGEILGLDASRETIERIVTRAAGNPLFLEELIRARATGHENEVPGSVLAMLHARLMRLDGGLRRLLRAASVFGEVFWQGGVTALLEGATTGEQAHAALAQLIEQELVERCRSSRISGDTEYRFRHALMRDAAYAMLVESDRAPSHRLAARFLEPIGDSDPLVLAEHYERGELPERAVPLYLRAAERALYGGDGDTAQYLGQHCLRLSTSGATRVPALAILMHVHAWRLEWTRCIEYFDTIVGEAPPDSPHRGPALMLKGLVAIIAGKRNEAIASMQGVLSLPEIPHPQILFGLMASGYQLGLLLRFDLAERCCERLERIAAPLERENPGAWGWHAVMATSHSFHLGVPFDGVRSGRAACQALAIAGNRRVAAMAQLILGQNLWALGSYAAANQELETALALGREIGLPHSFGVPTLSVSLAAAGRVGEAQQIAEQFLAAAGDNPMAIGLGHWALAETLLRCGDHAAAETEARRADELLRSITLWWLVARGTLAGILARRGRCDEALAVASESLGTYRDAGMRGLGCTRAWIQVGENQRALGLAEAETTLAAARARVRSEASSILDPELHHAFCVEVPEHARMLG